MSKVLIFGVEKMAELAHFYFTHDSDDEIVAFTVDQQYAGGQNFRGLPLVSFEDIETKYPPDEFKMFIAIGYKKLNTLRAKKYFEAKEKGYELVSYFSSKATHWNDTIIGDNCFILENQVIQPNVRFGNDVVIWSGNHFGHDAVVGDHCWLSSHIVVSGNVVIEPYSFVGVNASLRDGVVVGRESIIGAGALILRNVKEKSVFVEQQTELYKLDSERFERLMDISK